MFFFLWIQDLMNEYYLNTANFLPPSGNSDLPIVKLMSHPSYRSFQAQTAALSLFPSIRIKYLPPAWDVSTPSNLQPGSAEISGVKEQREWKRRIKMYRVYFCYCIWHGMMGVSDVFCCSWTCGRGLWVRTNPIWILTSCRVTGSDQDRGVV